MTRLFLACALLVAAPLGAQKPDRHAAQLDSLLAAPRPALPAGADTNDAEAYLRAGREWSEGCADSPFMLMLARAGIVVLSRKPERCDARQAAAAFHWAARLDPARAEPLMLGWEQTWAASPEAGEKAWKRDKRFVASGVEERVDSLRLRALYLNPFVSQFTGGGGSVPSGRAFVRRRPTDVEARIYLASAHYGARSYDSTITQLEEAIRILDTRDSARLTRAYVSKAMFHFAIGHALIGKGDRRAAQDSFRRALVEDLAFYPAHAALAVIAWENWNDSTTALQEFELALQTGATDAALRYNYGTVLMELRRPADALAQFEAAMARTPEYAVVYHNAGVAAERLGRKDEAMRHYREFVRRAPRRMKDATARVEARLATLSGG